MIKRPKSDDTEKDVLQMQLEFLKEKERNSNFQPAAKMVKMNDGNKSGKRQSEFAKRRGHKAGESAEVKTSPNIIMGDIVERKNQMEVDSVPSDSAERDFPVSEKIDPNLKADKGISIFAQMKLKAKTEEAGPSRREQINFGEKSILNCPEADKIHEENVKLLSSMSKEELQEEREKLLTTLDPSIVEFLKRKKESSKTTKMEVPEEIPKEEKFVPEIFETARKENWLNFDQVEEDKLEWMKDMPISVPKLEPGQSFEARFDWKGILLPYNLEIEESNRDLFLHNDEPQRAGYTLQELFRLARSDVIQQRISSLTAISGIINIFNQGFYDSVLDLPVSKIFFLLRFALDDKAINIVDAAALGLANLFYNSSDEFLLDSIFETKLGYVQPTFSNDRRDLSSLEAKMGNLNISNRFKTTIESDEMRNEEELNDFHLAETDLIKCLLRTSILERIRYILKVLKPNSSLQLTTSCLKILIRLARNGKEEASKVVETEDLLDYLMDQLNVKDQPVITKFILKLFRVLLSSKSPIKLDYLKLLDNVKGIVFNRDDLNVEFINLHLEGLRLVRTLLSYPSLESHYSDFTPTLRYYLEWHYQFLDLRSSSNTLICHHAAAVINLMNHNQFSWDRSICTELLVLCFRKWITLFGEILKDRDSQIDLSLILVVNSSLEFCLSKPEAFEAIKSELNTLLNSTEFCEKIIKNISNLNDILNHVSDRKTALNSLPNLGGVKFDKDMNPNLVIAQSSVSILIQSVVLLILKYDIKFEPLNIQMEKYLELYRDNTSLLQKLNGNWFYRHDFEIIFNSLDLIKESKSLSLNISCQLLSCFSSNQMDRINYILNVFIFNPEFYPIHLNYSNEEILKWKEIFIQFYRMRNETDEENQAVFPLKWPTEILNIIYEQHVESSNKLTVQIEKETENRIIDASFGIANLFEANKIKLNTPVENLIHLMMPFLSTECTFLSSEIKDIILKRCNLLKIVFQNVSFDFEQVSIKSKFDFDSFYTIFLNHFQSSGYGDKLFSAFVLIPLATKYGVKYRKMVWSEHIAVLRFITCNEDELIFANFNDFIANPVENIKSDPNYEASLIKSYGQAIKSNSLRPGTIPFKIAEFYLKKIDNYKKSVAKQ